MTLIAKLRAQTDLASISFLAVTFITGVAVALQMPTFSLFLAEEVQVRPMLIGLFYTLNAVIGILISQWLAKRSDRKGSRKTLIFRCCLVGVLHSLLFAYSREYWVLATAGIVLSSIASTASPQMYALAREYTDLKQRRSEMFTSVMRAQFSLAWVVGPPLAFALAVGYGFKTMYIFAALSYLLCALVAWYGLPALPLPEVKHHEKPVSAWRDPDVRLLCLASTAMWSANTMYLMNMPLYITRDLGLPESLAGIMMGTAAAIEIPIMLVAGHYTAKVGKKPLILFATAAGILFYAGLCFLESRHMLLALQLFNAIFIGIVAGISMSWFQDLMPGRAGAATTLFSNTIRTGTIIGGAAGGIIAEYLGFHSVFIAGLVFVILSFLWCARVRER